MSSSRRARERDWEVVIAERLREEGFDVIIEPGPEHLPFDLAGYKPDLIAIRPDVGLIIEVKPTEERLAIDRFVEVAALVRQHPGWRFLLIPAERLDESELGALSSIPTREELSQRAQAAATLLANDMYVPAFVTAWSSTEGMLRRLADENDVPVASLSPVALTKHLYSHGLLSMKQFSDLQALMPIRNRIVHGFHDSRIVDATPSLVSLLFELLGRETPFRPAI